MGQLCFRCYRKLFKLPPHQLSEPQTSFTYDDDIFIYYYDISRAIENIPLNKTDQKILKNFIDGNTIRDIGEKLHRDYSRISRRLDKICKKIENFLEGSNKSSRK